MISDAPIYFLHCEDNLDVKQKKKSYIVAAPGVIVVFLPFGVHVLLDLQDSLKAIHIV